MSTYKVGNGQQQIKFAADIDTFGLAASRAITVNLATNDPAVTVGHSLDATGDIPRKEIGTADSLAGKRLAILTKIDLVGDEDARKKESKRLTAKYFLDNGAAGYKVFDDPEKTISDDFFSVILYKEIDLIGQP